jgi:hypothetical protein
VSRVWFGARFTGVIVTALGGDGRVLREVQVELHDRTSLSIRVPDGTRNLMLEGTTTETPRARIELGPERRIVDPPVRRRWRRRR